MSRIRKILKKIHSKARIVTIRGLGYKLTSKKNVQKAAQ